MGRPFFGRQSSRFSSLAAMNGDITSPSNDLASSSGFAAKNKAEAVFDKDMDDLMLDSMEVDADSRRADPSMNSGNKSPMYTYNEESSCA